MPVFRMVAADEGIQAFDPVDQTLFHQELERSIDRRWRGRFITFPKVVQDRVSADRPVAVPNQFQDPAAERGQPGPTLSTNRFGQTQCIRDAAGVVVGGRGLEWVKFQEGSPSVKPLQTLRSYLSVSWGAMGFRASAREVYYFTQKCGIQ